LAALVIVTISFAVVFVVTALLTSM
jgi:hypothetical protein